MNEERTPTPEEMAEQEAEMGGMVGEALKGEAEKVDVSGDVMKKIEAAKKEDEAA